MPLNESQVAVVTGKLQQFKAKQHNPTKQLAHDDELFGVEIELEQFQDQQGAIHFCEDNGWTEHAEGSLVNGREFVMFPPRNGEDAVKSIDWFFNQGFRFTASERTSIHIHVDMTAFGITVGQLRSVLALTYLLEGAIYRVADENRKWGSYSCPLTDMGPDRLLPLFASDDRTHVTKAITGTYHEEKYYGCNVVSLRKHGTLEFRYFPCVKDKKKLLQFINLCLELKKVGVKFRDPAHLYNEVTEVGLIEFIKLHMPASCDSLLVYLDVEDAIERITAINAIVTDPNVLKKPVPCLKQKRSPAIERYLNHRRAIQGENGKPAVREDEGNLLDLYEMLRLQQRRALDGAALDVFAYGRAFAGRLAAPQRLNDADEQF